METISINNLKEEEAFSGDLLLDSNFLLLPQTAPLTKDLLDALKEWEFDTVLCEGSFNIRNQNDKTSEDDDSEESHKMGKSIKQAIENSKRAGIGNSDKARMDMVQRVYDEYMNYIESVFTHYATHKTIDQKELAETVQELCVFIKENKSYILRVTQAQDKSNKNFLVGHSMKTTVVAIAIALQLHMPLSKMIELGETCIIHEIGMLRLPPQIYMTDRKLTPGERQQIYKHPLLGYSIIKDLDFPLSVQLGVLEHHEDENGTGYPRKINSEKISNAAKIIAVACSFEAITSPRTFREGKSTFEAIIEMLLNKNHKYDDAIIKALLYTVSLYPLGSYVYLSNKKPALVVDTNPNNPKFPIVQLLTEYEDDGSLKTLQTSENGIGITRILSKTEREDLLKVLENIQKEEAEKKTEVKKEEKAPAANNENKEIKEEEKDNNKAAEEKVQEEMTAESETSHTSDGTEEIDISFFS
ncbi:MAG: HD domain-containing protein [Treponema sp.]|nr:HD domain-containing protein [Treponema sp.]